jgi:hypothetical protein
MLFFFSIFNSVSALLCAYIDNSSYLAQDHAVSIPLLVVPSTLWKVLRSVASLLSLIHLDSTLLSSIVGQQDIASSKTGTARN